MNDILSCVASHLPVFLGVAVLAYLLGCFNGAVIVSKYILKDDVRQYGSGNAGLTNFHRTFGGMLTFVVILCDMLKAALSVLLAMWAVRNFVADEALIVTFSKYWGGLFCLFGHMFPCFFKFKGGKGVLSGGMIAIMIDWRIALVVWGGFLILVALTRYISLGSVWAGASFPFATWFVYQNWVLTVMGMLMGWMLVYLHRGNIHRLLTGTERKFSFKKK